MSDCFLEMPSSTSTVPLDPSLRVGAVRGHLRSDGRRLAAPTGPEHHAEHLQDQYWYLMPRPPCARIMLPRAARSRGTSRLPHALRQLPARPGIRPDTAGTISAVSGPEACGRFSWVAASRHSPDYCCDVFCASRVIDSEEMRSMQVRRNAFDGCQTRTRRVDASV